MIPACNDSTIVAPRGWWDLADADQFYPSDLPADWQLAYFANEFRATLLPLDCWSTADPATPTQWREDVPTTFSFVAEAPRRRPVAGESQPEMRALEQALDRRLVAWIAPSAEPALAPTTAGESPTAALTGWRPGADRAPAPVNVVQAPSSLHSDLRAAKRWLAALRDHPRGARRIVILACPTSAALRDWHELLDLLGLS